MNQQSRRGSFIIPDANDNDNIPEDDNDNRPEGQSAAKKPKFQPIVGRLIRAHRQQMGLSQAALADILGYSHPNYIGMIETGRSQFPIERWADYAEALNIPKSIIIEHALRERYPDMMKYIRVDEF